ncbi:MAG: hypothetical protein MZV64_17455 [Ignavibacteriales bacterium]|nr:hypothetical protein [Ignavibacteriales bacterium]
MSDYPVSRQVLLTGNPVILQGEFDAEEKQWMDELGRTALVLLAMKAGRKAVGLIEIASTREKHLLRAAYPGRLPKNPGRNRGDHPRSVVGERS